MTGAGWGFLAGGRAGFGGPMSSSESVSGGGGAGWRKLLTSFLSVLKSGISQLGCGGGAASNTVSFGLASVKTKW